MSNLKKWLEKQVAGSNSNSVAIKMRRRRMEEFEEFFYKCFAEDIKSRRRLTILDLGGTYYYWKSVGFKYKDICAITLLNMETIKLPESDVGGYLTVQGDATNLSECANKSFDLVFSNSVIEHVGDRSKQQAMADEMRRVGKHYYLQTPNYWFPFEPHYRLPFMQFLPIKIRAWFGIKWKMGYFKNVRTMNEAIETARGIVLLKRRDLQKLFHGVKVRNEKMGPLTKSFYLYG